MKKIILPISFLMIGTCVITSFVWTIKPDYIFTMNSEHAYPDDMEDIHYTIQMEDGTQQWNITGINDKLSYKAKYLNSFKQPSSYQMETEALQGYLNYQPMLPEHVVLETLDIIETKEETYRNSENTKPRLSINDYYETDQVDLALFVETVDGYAAFPVPMQIVQKGEHNIKFLYNTMDGELYFESSFYSRGKSYLNRWKHPAVQLHDQTYVASYSIRDRMEGNEAIYRIHSDYKSDHKQLPSLSETMEATKVDVIYTLPGAYMLQDMLAYEDYLYIIMVDDDIQKLVKLDGQGNVMEEFVLGDKGQTLVNMQIVNQALCITVHSSENYTFFVYEYDEMRIQASYQGVMNQVKYDYHDGVLYTMFQNEEDNLKGLSVMLSVFKEDQMIYFGQLQGDYQDDQNVETLFEKEGIQQLEFHVPFKRVITNYAFAEEDPS